MSAGYRAVGWSPGKKRYDLAIVAAIVLFLGAFAGVSLAVRPETTVETILIHGFGLVAILLLHVILAIGPAARLDRRFLPLLWNRRHLGVTMFLCAAAHGGLALFQFHALGDRNPFVSLLTSNTRFASVADFPFQQLGFAALAILFLMAATSHDFWLANLTAPVWKSLHMMVYVAYGLVVAHVALGVLQDDPGLLVPLLFGGGVVALAGLHLAAARKGRALDRELAGAREDGFVEACRASEIREGRARIVTLSDERVAIFRYDAKLSAVSNVCQHQNGPLGEGRIVDGCITCPWHGYQYRPDDGRSPAPFTERVPTFRLRLLDGDRVFVDPKPLAAGTRVEPVLLPEESKKSAHKGTDGEAAASGEEFFVGYLPVPPDLARFARAAAITVVVAFGVMGALVASAQRPLGRGEFDFAKETTYRGLLTTVPVPGLWPQGEGAPSGTPLTGAFFPLVGEGKHGAPEATLASAGRFVELEGHRIERFGQQLVEVVGSRAIGDGSGSAAPPPVPLGRQRLRGEIVDSKCFYGVMKPAAGKAHRDCAVRCISGGAPPAFVVRSPSGEVAVLLLVGADGRSIAGRVLDRVAEPVEVEGEVSLSGDRLVLAADPAAIRRIAE